MNVLIVDDDMATVDVICKSVNWSALHIDKVMTAYNIEKAKEMLADIPADIVVCDIEMPMGNGTELLKWVRENDMSSRNFCFSPAIQNFSTRLWGNPLSGGWLSGKTIPCRAGRSRTFTPGPEDHGRSWKIEEESHYGKWMRNNQEQLMNNFWKWL